MLRARDEQECSLTEELRKSVRVHCRGARAASADVSGIDSSTIAAFASEVTDRVAALTMASRDPGDDDLGWATMLVAHVGGLMTHTIVAADDLPYFYDHVDVAGSGLLFDEPHPTILDLPRQMAGYAQMAAAGHETHFTGMGGDHLFTALAQHYLSDPLMWWRQRREARAVMGIGALSVARTLLSGPGFMRWKKTVSRNLLSNRSTATGPDWDHRPIVPAWATVRARRHAQKELERYPAPNTPRMRHLEWRSIQAGAEALRPLEQATAKLGLHLASPFFDDRVAHTVLSTPAAKRYSLREYKPMLKAAAAAYFSDELLARSTKGMAVLDEYRGLQRNAEKLCAIFTESALAERGLIDETLIRHLILHPTDPRMDLGQFDRTLALENWVRAQQQKEAQWGRGYEAE